MMKLCLMHSLIASLSLLIKDEMASRELPANLNRLIDVANKVDSQFQLRWKEKSMNRPRKAVLPTIQPPVLSSTSTTDKCKWITLDSLLRNDRDALHLMPVSTVAR